MTGKFIQTCESYIADEGVSFKAVSRKTGIPYERLRSIRRGDVIPNVIEFARLGSYCKLNLQEYINEAILN